MRRTREERARELLKRLREEFPKTHFQIPLGQSLGKHNGEYLYCASDKSLEVESFLKEQGWLFHSAEYKGDRYMLHLVYGDE